jgi:hypothetical protein
MNAVRALLAALAVFAIGALTGCGGGGGGSSPATIVVTVTPATITVMPGKTQAFAATVTNTANTAVTWSIQEGTIGGTITDAGKYAAPATEGTYHVVATSKVDGSKTGVGTVTVKNTIGKIVFNVAKMPPQAQSCRSSVVIDPQTGFVVAVTTDKVNGVLTPAIITVDVIGQQSTFPCTVTAFTELGARGVAMAKGTISAVVTRGVENHVSVTMASLVEQVVVTPVGRTVDVGTKTPHSVSFRNIAGQVIPTGPPTWETSDHAVAAVDQTGLVTAIAAGSVRVIATDSDSGKTGYATLTVNPVASYDPGIAGTFSFTGTSLNTNADGANKLPSQVTPLPNGGYVVLDMVGTVRLLDSAGQRKAIVDVGETLYRGALVGSTFWVACSDQGTTKLFDCNNNLAIVESLPIGRFRKATYVPETGKVLLSGEGGVLECATTAPYASTELVQSATYGATGDSKYVWYSFGAKIFKIDRNGNAQGSFTAPNMPYDILAIPGFNAIAVADVTTKKVVWFDKSGTLLASAAMPDASQVRAFGLAGASHEGTMPSNSTFITYGWRVSPL